MTDDNSSEVFLCRQRHLGCGKVKDLASFSYERKAGAWRPDLCDACHAEMVRLYGVNFKQVRLLCTVLHHEVMLANQARAMTKANLEDQLRMMVNTAPQRIHTLVRDLIAVHEHEKMSISEMASAAYRVYRAYREWWFAQVGLAVEFGVPSPVKGFSTARIAA